MKLEIGKFYKTRDGRKAGPVRDGWKSEAAAQPNLYGTYKAAVECDSQPTIGHAQGIQTHPRCDCHDCTQARASERLYEQFKPKPETK